MMVFPWTCRAHFTLVSVPDPGGEKAILLYAGRDATEEFNMFVLAFSALSAWPPPDTMLLRVLTLLSFESFRLHDPKVISKYAADTSK